MKKLLLFSLCFLLFSITQVFAQGRTITGTVTAKEDGLPIPGATVQVKGTTIGTQTSVQGTYTLKNVPANAVLVFKFIGYATQEIPSGDRSAVNAVLATSNTTLNEVVVTSLGVVRQSRSLGYGVSKVTNEQVTQKSEPDLLKALEGKVAGVDIRASQGTPGSATRIQIRGNTSFLGNNQPLIVVDGVPYSNDQVTTTGQLTGGGAYSSGIADLDPNDIASMNILKGSSGAALYGSRASNGVIVITTKSGSANRSKKGLEVTLKSSAAIEQIANLPEYQNLYGAGSEGNYSNSNGSWGPAFTDRTTIPVWPDYKAAYPALFPGTTVPYVAYPNNVKDLFRNGAVYENSVNLNGGDEKNAVNLTASQLNQNGYVPNSGYNRAAVALGGSSKLQMGLHINGNLSYTRSNQIGGFFGENQVAGVPSEFARSLFLARNWDLNLPFETPEGISLTPNGSQQFDNPRWSAKYNTSQTAEERFIANGRADIDIAKIFNLSTTLGSNVNSLARREVVEIGSRAAQGLGSLTIDNYRRQEIESTSLLTLKQQKVSDFGIDAFVGFNFNQRTTTRNAEVGNQFVTRGIHTLTNTSQQIFLTDTYERRRLFGALGQLNVGYKDWAFLGLSGRNDWSSTLPTNNRSYFYYSATGSLVFTDALKLQSDVLSYGKLRAAYSKVGRDADPYFLSNVFVIGSNFLGQPTAYNTTTATDPNLQPEFTKELELGTELSFFDRRIDLDFAWYNKKTTNVIIGIPTPSSTGFGRFYTNAGQISNKGIEIELTGRPFRSSKGFNWTLTGTFTRNINMVDKLKEGVTRIDLGTVLTSISTYAEAGMPYGYLRGTVNYRDANGNLLINPQTGGLIENTEQAFLGNAYPKAKIGVNNTFSYKGFSLTALVDMTIGGSIFTETVNTELGRGVTKDTENRSTSWVIPGYYGDTNTGLPLLVNGQEVPNQTRLTTNDLYFASDAAHETFAINAASEWSVYDATVYRLREVTFGYTFPKTMFQRLPIGSVTVSVSGRNLFYYAPYMPKYSHFDPETNSFGSSNVQGIEVSTAPTVKRYGVNLTVTF